MNDRLKNNLAFWYPKLKASGVLTPMTAIVESDDVVMAAYGEPCPELDPLVEKLTEEARLFGFPVFLRTGYGSGKHEWKDTCFVKRAEDIRAHVLALIEWSELVDMMGLPTRTWVVREFLALDVAFTAFHGRMPVNRERRYFFADGKVICSHAYWPPRSIADQDPSVTDWEAKLDRLNEQNTAEVAYLTEQTERVASHFDGAWSLDWAQTENGDWFAIDMAQAAHSFHWDGCPHAARFRTPDPTQREIAIEALFGRREAT